MTRLTPKICQLLTKADLQKHPYYKHIVGRATLKRDELCKALLAHQRKVDRLKKAKAIKKGTKKVATRKSTRIASSKKGIKKIVKKGRKKVEKRIPKRVTASNCMSKSITLFDIKASEEYTRYKGRSKLRGKQGICEAIFGPGSKRSPVKPKSEAELNEKNCKTLSLRELKSLQSFKDIVGRSKYNTRDKICKALFDETLVRKPSKPKSVSEMNPDNCVVLTRKELMALPEYKQLERPSQLKNKRAICKALLQLKKTSPRSIPKSPKKTLEKRIKKTRSPKAETPDEFDSGKKETPKRVKSPKKARSPKSAMLDEFDGGKNETPKRVKSPKKTRSPVPSLDISRGEEFTRGDYLVLEKLVNDWQEAYGKEFQLDNTIGSFLYNRSFGLYQDGQMVSPFEGEDLSSVEIDVLLKLDAMVKAGQLSEKDPIPMRVESPRN